MKIDADDSSDKIEKKKASPKKHFVMKMCTVARSLECSHFCSKEAAGRPRADNVLICHTLCAVAYNVSSSFPLRFICPYVIVAGWGTFRLLRAPLLLLLSFRGLVVHLLL